MPLTPAPRQSLQAYQAELARKLAESAERPVAAGWLGVSWRGVRALVPLTQAAEIFNPTALQRLPHTQPWVMGVASLRGGLSVVVDWVHLLQLPAQAPALGAEDTLYWLHLHPALGVQAALCVDQLLGLRDVQDMVVAPGSTASLGIQQTCVDAQGQHWVELDLRGLCESSTFLDLRLPAFAQSVPTGT